MEGEISPNRVVVLGIDDSEWSERAFDYYLKNVHRDTDRLVAVHCVEPIHPPLVPGSMSLPEWKDQWDKHQKRIKDVEHKYVKKAKENKVSLTVSVVSDSSPGEAVCTKAKKENASLVVLGSRGAGLLRRTVIGSVSSYVVHHAHVPVLVCPKSQG